MRVSVGVPPANVTASLRLTVSVTTLPAASVPAPLLMPVPHVVDDLSVGKVVGVQTCAVGLATAPVRFAALPAASLMVAVPGLTAVTARSDVFCPAATV